MHLRKCCTPLQSGWAVLQGSADEGGRRGRPGAPSLSLRSANISPRRFQHCAGLRSERDSWAGPCFPQV